VLRRDLDNLKGIEEENKRKEEKLKDEF